MNVSHFSGNTEFRQISDYLSDSQLLENAIANKDTGKVTILPLSVSAGKQSNQWKTSDKGCKKNLPSCCLPVNISKVQMYSKIRLI
ncbi:hypothetical protein FKM82_031181 [Ascaphus truei]